MRAIGNGFIRRATEGLAQGTGPNSTRCSTWHMATNDTHAAVIAANFFNGMAADMRVGDQIFASIDLDGTPQCRHYMVSVNTGTVVTIVQVNNS